MEVSILQWNVLFKEKADSILKLIKQVDADIVCLQELTTNSEANPNRNIPKDIVSLGYNQYYIQTINRAEIDMGNGIFSKFPIEKKRHVFVQREEPGVLDYSKENRIYIETNVKVGQKSLIIGTVHLSYAHQFIDTAEKKRETDMLIDAVKNNKSNFVLAGDLNAVPNSYTIKSLGKLFKSADPPYNKPTWTTKPFSYGGFEADKLGWRLDYVFTTPDIEVIESTVMDTDYSDHLPILIKLKI